MAYNKPACECGEELDVVTSTMHTDTFKVLKNGMVAKTKKCKTNTENWLIDLQCPSCEKAYELKTDEKERTIRGVLKEDF